MNIFVLSLNPYRCAVYHNQRHCTKMILEHIQMLSTACRESGIDVGYKTSHRFHPCSIWTRESLSNWRWLKELTQHLHEEWKYRFDHPDIDHKAYTMMMTLPEPNIEDKGLTPFAQAMPEEYRHPDPIKAYRTYYMADKRHLADWGKQEIPHWWK
jgi:hypothetical protein